MTTKKEIPDWTGEGTRYYDMAVYKGGGQLAVSAEVELTEDQLQKERQQIIEFGHDGINPD